MAIASKNKGANIISSVVLRLTFSYLAILMTVSFLLSGLIYTTVTAEVTGRLSSLGTRIISNPDDTTQQRILRFQSEEAKETRQNIISFIIVLNISILILGGFASYAIASNTLGSIEAAHKAQARFVSDASHELRTPLAAMKSEMEASLHDKSITKNELKETLQSTVEEVDKMTGLTTMLLDLSHVNAIDFDPQSVEISHAIQSVIDRTDNSKKILLKPSRPAYIRGNEIALETVFNILIDNAMKYSPAKSKVIISITQNTNKVFIRVSNNGKGINKEDINHIFEHFYRGQNGSGKSQGYGMGLALAKEIVMHHSGRIDVKSTTGELTIFTVVLPKNSKSLSVI